MPPCAAWNSARWTSSASRPGSVSLDIEKDRQRTDRQSQSGSRGQSCRFSILRPSPNLTPRYEVMPEAPQVATLPCQGRVKEVGASLITPSSPTYPTPPSLTGKGAGGLGSFGGLGPAGLRVLVIGASTGGPRALQTLVPALPADLNIRHCHRPAHAAGLLRHLPRATPGSDLVVLTVREAAEGDRLQPGQMVLVAPGGHAICSLTRAARRILTSEPPVHGVRPAIDVTLSSLAPVVRPAPDGRRC